MKVFKKIPLVVTIILATLYGLGCLLPWLSPTHFWLLAFIGFVFPYLTICLLVSAVIWLFIKPKYALFFLLILGLGYKQIFCVFAFNTNTTFKKDKPNHSIRIATFNIGCLSAKAGYKGAQKHKTEDVLNALFEQKADIICLQEFLDLREHKTKEYFDIEKKYPHVYYPFWHIGPHFHRGGCIIFSKYPIINADSLIYKMGENVLRADVLCYDDTISVFTTHFSSYQFSKEQLEEINNEPKAELTEAKSEWKNIIKKVKQQTNTHNYQAGVVNDFIAKTNHPFVFCGDLNEVPNNNVYWKMRVNKQDAFLEKGFGFGKTFNTLNALLRIDYIMPDNNFKIHQFNLIERGLSDHAILVSDIELINAK